MDKVCLKCYEKPKSHSFNCVCEINDREYIFYTKISESILYNDTDGILKHYENMLNYVEPKSWIWIVNCDGYSLKHSLEIRTAIGLAKLINRFGRVKKILVINTNSFINGVYLIINKFLSNDTKNKIVFIKSEESNKFKQELNNFNIESKYYEEFIKLI